MKKIVPLLLLLAAILPFACTKSLTSDHLSSDASPVLQHKYLVGLEGSLYNGSFQYTDSLQVSALSFSQPGYISSYFVYYSGGRPQTILSSNDSLGLVRDTVFTFVYDPSMGRALKIVHDSGYDSLGYDGLGRLSSIYRYNGIPLAFWEFDSLTVDINNDLMTEYQIPVTDNYRTLHFEYDSAANPLQASNLGFLLGVVNGGAWEDLSTHNVLTRSIHTSTLSAPAQVLVETDTNTYTYGGDGLPLSVIEKQVNMATGTLVYSFDYVYSVK